jgi:hypothetical protein
LSRSPDLAEGRVYGGRILFAAVPWTSNVSVSREINRRQPVAPSMTVGRSASLPAVVHGERVLNCDRPAHRFHADEKDPLGTRFRKSLPDKALYLTFDATNRNTSSISGVCCFLPGSRVRRSIVGDRKGRCRARRTPPSNFN